MRLPSIHSLLLDFLGSNFPALLPPSPKLEWIEKCWPSSGWSSRSELLCSADAFNFFQPCPGSQVIFGECESIFRRMASDDSTESCGSAGNKGRVAWHGRFDLGEAETAVFPSLSPPAALRLLTQAQRSSPRAWSQPAPLSPSQCVL